jgi:hypothetical protein
MMGFVPRDFNDVPLKETKAGTIVSIVLSMASMGALSVCLGKESSTDLASSWKLTERQLDAFKMYETGPDSL